ncbi:DUF1996 domain-containing protein [Streptomyces sp. GXMU-J15]|uniref:DUF1996 domain-containing protein n=1 Tax=Streptomyces fuscus TaxID=3048495 RepID=A0ABT7J2R7_9ACTN|nr:MULTISPECIES: DUF1996 domain-containing protein [Streptomyces]MDL2079149.1 DUF1996 domain-containing protein [Streptomyces fuscus]SBT92853.1 protein of unknown function [Streptomyces sp. DI166]
MGRNTRKRRTPLATKAIAASAALALGGGGLIWANFYASAHESGDQNRTRSAAAQIATIDCPDVGQQLTDVPNQARGEVDGELATLDQQITEAYQRLATTRDAQARDGSFVQNTILQPLKDRRKAIIDRIQLEINRAGGNASEDLDNLSGCTGTPAQTTDGQAGQDQNGDGQNQGGQDQGGDQGGQDQGGQDQGGQDQGGQDQGGDQGQGGQVNNGPTADDFVDITQVQGNAQLGVGTNGLPANGRSGSRGVFITKCGTNSNDNHNTDNIIAAPGVSNGAHHLHDYVGNQGNNAFASDQDLANAQTTCQNQGDRSSYFWPVLRLQDGTQEFDQNNAGGGTEGNVGKILEPVQAQLKFVGNKRSKVVAMPRALRIITGDAKSFVNGNGNANVNWSCTGFENKVQLKDKYPICPQGSQVVRTTNFQSCWDGQNIDSANHRTHTAFVQADGRCANGFKAIPQLQVRLVYDVPAPRIENGQVVNPYAVDSFPEQLHKPITDHNDFINFFSTRLMNKMVKCINSGQRCQ